MNSSTSSSGQSSSASARISARSAVVSGFTSCPATISWGVLDVQKSLAGAGAGLEDGWVSALMTTPPRLTGRTTLQDYSITQTGLALLPGRSYSPDAANATLPNGFTRWKWNEDRGPASFPMKR